MEGDDSNTSTPASSTSSPLSSAPNSRSPTPAPRVTVIAPPVQKGKGSYWWRQEESLVYEELLESYGENPVDWKEVARELARRCPMDPAPARTAKQCSARRGYLERCANRPEEGRRVATEWNAGRWEQLKAAASEALKASGTNRLTTVQWGEVGKTLEPKRTAAACAERWRKGAPKGGDSGRQVARIRALEEDVEFSSSKRQLPESASSFTLSPTRERLYRPRTPHVSVLPSSAEPPFSPENDDQLLELYRLKGPAYKTISRAVEPQRHKKEVNGRLDYLLQPYDFATFFPSDV